MRLHTLDGKETCVLIDVFEKHAKSIRRVAKMRLHTLDGKETLASIDVFEKHAKKQ